MFAPQARGCLPPKLRVAGRRDEVGRLLYPSPPVHSLCASNPQVGQKRGRSQFEGPAEVEPPTATKRIRTGQAAQQVSGWVVEWVRPPLMPSLLFAWGGEGRCVHLGT